MLKFMRNKWVTIHRKGLDILAAHGVLDDDIYSLEIDLLIRISDLKILSINGKWNRWTTPECPRALPYLQEVVGFRIEEGGFSQKVHKTIGRRACRHFANILLECCHAAEEAAMLSRWEDETAKTPSLTFEEFLNGESKKSFQPVQVRPVIGKEKPVPEEKSVTETGKDITAGDMIIDLHVHTSPASPCSSIPVDVIIEEAKQIGLGGICLTDHNYVWDPGLVEDLRQKHGFLILRGNEITTDQGDMVVFGLEKDIRGIIKLAELKEEVSKVGGFIIVAHPFRGFLTFGVGQLGLTPEKAMERPLFKLVDAIEVLNGKVTEKENRFASSVAAGLRLPATGGSDAHEADEVGAYATRFADVINNEEDLITALKTGVYKPVAYRKEKGLC